MMPEAWSDLLEALELLAKGHVDPARPFHCEHDSLTVMSDPAEFTTEELDILESLGFYADPENGLFYSFRYGSA